MPAVANHYAGFYLMNPGQFQFGDLMYIICCPEHVSHARMPVEVCARKPCHKKCKKYQEYLKPGFLRGKGRGKDKNLILNFD